MKTATALVLVAIGAILAFAVTANTSVFNIHVAGWVILLTGVAGLFIPRRSYAWVNRRIVQRRSRSWPSGKMVESTETTTPPYVVRAHPGAGSDAERPPDVPSLPHHPEVHQ